MCKLSVLLDIRNCLNLDNDISLSLVSNDRRPRNTNESSALWDKQTEVQR